MKFDLQNGRLVISQELVFSPQEALSKFTARADFDTWENVKHEEPYSVYRKNLVTSNAGKVNICVYFVKSVLWNVDLSFFLPDEDEFRSRRKGDYPDTDIRRSLLDTRRWQLHEQILHSELGAPPYKYSWGFISLAHSQIDWLAVIKIEYLLGTL